MKIPNKNARMHVQKKEKFDASNMWGEWRMGRTKDEPLYVVYSYSYTWPMFIYDPIVDGWYENDESFSPSTSKHSSQAHPHCDTVKLSQNDMQAIERGGSTALLEKLAR